MKFYWTIRLIPEIADLPRKDRQRIASGALRRTVKHWEAWAYLLLSFALLKLVQALVRNLFGEAGMSVEIASLLLATGCFYFLFQLHLSFSRDYFRDEVKKLKRSVSASSAG